MKTLLLLYCGLFFMIGGAAFSQNKYYETMLDSPLRSDLYCVVVESDSEFSVIGRYAINFDAFDKIYSFFAKSHHFSMETPITYYDVDTIGGDLGVYDIVKTEYGYVATGYISINEVDENYYIFLLYLDSEGGIIEMKNITPYNDASLGYSIAQNTEGNLFIAGYYTPPFMSPIRDKLYLTKLSPSGQKLWEYANLSYPDNCAFRAVLPSEDGGCYAAGYVGFYTSLSGDFVLTKLNSNGIENWTKVYDFESGGDYAVGLINTPDNCLMLCGRSGMYRAHLMKVKLNGDTLWNKQYFQNEDRSGFLKVASMPDTTYVAIGSIKSNDDPDMDLHITKVDSLGNLMWHRRYGQVGNNRLRV
jgi:hypothetical protein